MRYQVSIFGRLHESHNYGSVDITHGFTSKARAESFARAIARYLPPYTDACNYGPLVWVLLYSLPKPQTKLRLGWTTPHCYLAFDPGGVVVKRHEILAGYFGEAA